MYNSYFGFREKPFKLVPNPDYLFLGKSHEIALAHLIYGTEQGEGFVVITGEVGTGKTTLCRNYLEGLDEHTASAYIFNPKLESAQLLASICGEFGILTEETSIKALLDLLNTYLIEQNAIGNKVVVLIDEAQGLSIENLELLRMLSNLETTRSKLLQIILVGQPELAHKLDSYELRQLSQRISISYHLSPLSAKESEAYIQHRLGIAAQRKATLFTANACRSAYHYSGGIPRLINIVCDRALLLAYSHNRPKVSKRLMQAAIRELITRGQVSADRRTWPYLIGGAALLLAAALATVYFIWQNKHTDNFSIQSDRPRGRLSATLPSADQTYKVALPSVPDSGATDSAVTSQKDMPNAAVHGTDSTKVTGKAVLAVPAPADPPVEASAPVTAPVPPLVPLPATAAAPAAEPQSAVVPLGQERLPMAVVIDGLDSRSSRRNAVHTMLSLWGQSRPTVDLLPNDLDDPLFIDLAARQYGLRTVASQWDWRLIEKLDLPAILTAKQPASGEDVFMTLVAKKGGALYLSAGESSFPIEADRVSIGQHLTGRMYIFWKNTLGFDMLISSGSDEKAILGVQRLLRQISYKTVPMSSVFDPTTRDAVKDFQRKNHLDADGLVGPLTKIMLLRKAGNNDMPHLSGEEKGDS
jgi:general secretion pathway protein A